MAKDLRSLLPADMTPIINIAQYATDPWMEAKAIEVHSELEGISSTSESEPVKREAALNRIRQVNAPIVIYTDGSAHGGTRMDGAAMVAMDGDLEMTNVLHTIERKGALYTCSYEEEIEAMKMTAKWITENCERDDNILICTDCQSQCMALRSYNKETDAIRKTLKHHEGKIIIQWIPGHSNIPGNDLANIAAKNATGLMEQGWAISLHSACMQIRSTFTDKTTGKGGVQCL